MTRNVLNFLCGRVAAAVAVAGALYLTGCANMVETAPPSGPAQSSGTMSGVVHGGQFPIYNAVVRLYSSGTGGYGSGSTLLATSANTDLGGGFSFTKNSTTGGVIDSTMPTWQCPSTGNPQIYITAVGGNTQGTGTTASTSNNPASALIVGLGPCSGVTTGETLVINEITTVATVFALAQYINPGGSTPGSLTVGTSSTTQGTTGINNAAGNIVNLATISDGYPVISNTYPGTNSATGASVTATPETAKIITIANILAACINSTNNVALSGTSTSGTTPTASTACADIYNNASPPAASVTSQPSATFAAPVDTIQAAYYMATNPTESNAATTSCYNSTTATTKLGCLYGLAASSPPFQTGLAAAPSDWTIGVTFTGSVGTGTCGGVTSSYLMAEPYHGAVDASGNLWFINGGSTTANIVELSPLGAPLVCVGNLSNGRGITIDSAGNIWGSFNGVVSSNTVGSVTSGIQELTAASAASTTPTLTTWPVATAQQTYTMTADGSGNVFFNVSASGGTLWEFPGAATASSPVAEVQISGPFNGSSTTNATYVQVDSSGRIWDSTSTTAALYDVYPSVTASITAYSVTGSTVTFTSANSFSVGNVVTVSGLSTTEGVLLNGTYTLTAATSSSFSAATTATAISSTPDTGTATPQAGAYSFTKLTTPNTPYGMAIDSNNYLYQGTTCCAGTGDREAIKWTPGTTGTATYTASASLFGGINGVRSVAVDGASNVWYGSEYPNSAGATATTGSFSVSEMTTTGSGTSATFTTLAPPSAVTYSSSTCSTTVGCPTQGGYIKAGFGEALDMEVDPSGDLWVLNAFNADGTNGISVTEVIGAAVPVVTPLSIAVKNSKLGTKP